jgi:hypothetical protein
MAVRVAIREVDVRIGQESKEQVSMLYDQDDKNIKREPERRRHSKELLQRLVCMEEAARYFAKHFASTHETPFIHVILKHTLQSRR